MSDLEFEEEYDEGTPSSLPKDKKLVFENVVKNEEETTENNEEENVEIKPEEKETQEVKKTENVTDSPKKEKNDKIPEKKPDSSHDVEKTQSHSPQKKEEAKKPAELPIPEKEDKSLEDIIQDPHNADEEKHQEHSEDVDKILESDTESDDIGLDIIPQAKTDKVSKISQLFTPFLDQEKVTYDEFLNLIVSDPKFLFFFFVFLDNFKEKK